jgi:hypothetical protein
LKYSDFCEAFVPKQTDFADALVTRKAYFIHHAIPREEYFSQSAQFDFINVWKVHLSNEISLESLRKRLSNRPYFNSHDAFKTCDLNDNGFITVEEIQSFLRIHNYFPTEGELQLLRERYDKNKDGRISYAEVSA